MRTKPLLYGLIGFFLGGLLVAIAASTFNRSNQDDAKTNTLMSSMSMDDMTADLKDKTGDSSDHSTIYIISSHYMPLGTMIDMHSFLT